MGDLSFAAKLEYVATQLKHAADSGLVRELERAITDACKPVLPQIRAGLGDYMPGGYAPLLSASLNLGISRQVGRGAAGRTGVSIRATSRPSGLSGRAANRAGVTQRKLRNLEEGVLAHPLFGDREHWYRQVAPGGGMRPGFFSAPVSRNAPQIRDHISEALDRVSREAGV